MTASEKKRLQQLLKVQRFQKHQILMYQKVMEGIRQDLEFKNLLKLIIRSVCKGLGFKRAGIFLVEPDGKSVRLAMGIDRKGRYEHDLDRIPITNRRGYGNFSDIIHGYKKYFFSNNIPKRVGKKNVFRVPVLNNALVPLQFGREKAIGALAVDNLNENRPITGADVQALMTFATEAGLAIESFRSHERMISLSFTDALTGLYNRRFFDKALAQEMGRCQRYGRFFSLLLIDIDHFKRVNDTYGHDAGDEIIQQVSKILQINLRSMDVVTRIGGEEFAIILPETPHQNLVVVVNRLLKEVRHAEPLVGTMASEGERTTISIGVASYNGGNVSTAELYKLADKSLYKAKRTGRDKSGPYYASAKTLKQLPPK